MHLHAQTWAPLLIQQLKYMNIATLINKAPSLISSTDQSTVRLNRDFAVVMKLQYCRRNHHVCKTIYAVAVRLDRIFCLKFIFIIFIRITTSAKVIIYSHTKAKSRYQPLLKELHNRVNFLPPLHGWFATNSLGCV